MSLDAQDWVWNHSQSKGTARLVLLAIADKAYGRNCSAYAGTTMLVQRANAARSSVVTAVDKLIELGELAVIDGQQGPRGETVYTLPKARRHRRPDQEGGPKSGPVRNPDRGGPKSGPLGVRNPDPITVVTQTPTLPPLPGPPQRAGTKAPKTASRKPSTTSSRSSKPWAKPGSSSPGRCPPKTSKPSPESSNVQA